jgi:hypothetical protein
MSLAKLGQVIIKKIATKKIKIISKLDTLISQFKNSCPSQDELIKIIKLRNRLISVLNQLKNNINTINKTTNPLKNLLKLLSTTATSLKLLPTPTAVGGVGIPMGAILTAGDALSITKEKLISFKSTIEVFESIKNYILQTITQILDKIKILDSLINKCAQEYIEAGADPNLINNILINDNVDLINELQNSSSNINNTYKGFKLEILIDDKNINKFPKRFAVAKTPNGVIVLRGESSFSSSPDILIEEIKFIIDRDNLKV